MLCLPVNAYCSRSICVLFIFIIESPFLLYYFILFILFLFKFSASLIKYRLFTWVGHEGGTVLLSGFAINWWQGWMAGWSRLRDLAHVKYRKIWLFIPTKWILIYACITFYTNQYVCVYYFILHHTYVWYKSFCFSNLPSIIYMYHLKIMLISFYKMSMLYIHVQNIYCSFHLF